jgi:NitT/TauT family transport system substrate-binding protein
MSQQKALRIRRKAATLMVFAAVAVIVILTLGFGSCRNSTNGGKPNPIVRVNIVTWPGYGPLYIAKEKGFFKDEGVDVDIQIQENTQARHAALVSGQVDLVGITLESVIHSNAPGIPMKVIGITDISNGGDGIIVKKDIQSIQDLKGKRVAFPEGQPSHLFLLYHLEKAGMSQKDIVPVYTDDAGKAGELFVAGQVDAAVTWEPWLSRISDEKKGSVLVNSKGVKDILIGILAANANKLPADQDKLQRFLRGWYRGLEYVQTHKDEALPIMARNFQLQPEEFSVIMNGLRFINKDEAKRLLGAEGGGGDFYGISEYEAELWRKSGVIAEGVQPSRVYTGDVIAGVQ